MFCTNCGGKMVEGKPFCITCGQAQPPVWESAAGPVLEEPKTPAEESNLVEVVESATPLDPGGSDHGPPVYRRDAETMSGRRVPNTNIEAKGFFASLFDFGFTSFITLKFLRVIYGVVVVLILLTGAFLFISSISQGGMYAVLAIVFVPIGTLIYLVITRVSMEIIALLFRIGENTSLMVAATNRTGATGEGPDSGLAG